MLLEVKSLNKTYHTGIVEFTALKNINLSVEKGEFTAFAGPSGSGKTTLLNCIGCLDRGESGSILLDGVDLMTKKTVELAHVRKENFGFIFQTYNLFPVLTIAENVEMPLKLLQKESQEEINEKVMKMLSKVGLSGYENRRPLELSGGQQQRVAVARALIKKPKLILADEPTANLDSKTGESVVELMKELNVNEGVTFLFSTHDSMVMKRASKLYEIHDGQIKASRKK
ncbi:MAG: ABC transporter ATP-binding protein [Spirochaetia bacterium]|nr:ABC transporter ATP-binding protein [Spirochaetia bacterium]